MPRIPTTAILCLTLWASAAFGYVVDYKGILLKNAKWGYLDTAGRVVIQPRFEQAEKFSEGRAAVRVGGRWGYIDKSGALVAAPRFEAAQPFAQGRAAVAVVPEPRPKDRPVNLRDYRWHYVDPSMADVGAPTVDLRAHGYTFAGQFSNGRARVGKDDKHGFIDLDGKVVIELQYKWTGDFSEGLAAVMLDDDKWGFIDVSGAVVIKPQFTGIQTGGFRGGLAPVQVEQALGERWGYIDRTGKLVIPADYDTAYPFEDGLALVRDTKGKYGFIDTTGRVVIPLKYWSASPFSEGLARVEENSDETGLWGHVDTSGQPALKNKRLYSSFHNARAVAQVFDDAHKDWPMGAFGFFDPTGKLAIPATFDWAEEFSEGLAAFATGADHAAVKAMMDAEHGVGEDKPGL